MRRRGLAKKDCREAHGDYRQCQSRSYMAGSIIFVGIFCQIPSIGSNRVIDRQRYMRSIVKSNDLSKTLSIWEPIVKDFAQLAVDHLKKAGVQYADARAIAQRRERIDVKDDKLESVADQSTKGIGVRVLEKGTWGFASTSELQNENVIACADRALEIARAGAGTTINPVELDERPAQQGSWKSPRIIDPFNTPLDQKIDLLLNASRVVSEQEGVTTAKGNIMFIGEDKYFVDTEGADLHQDILHSGGGIEALAERDGDVQKQSHPNSHRGGWAAAGYEYIKEMGLVDNAEKIGKGAVELLDAMECPHGEYDLIVAGPQLALQIHESCGHPTELDRALGTEISLAGGSFMTPDRLGKLQYGSEKVNLYGDATIEGALGSFGWDDEGVPAQRFDIVKDGLFVGYQTSRETAKSLGLNSNGTMRADGWARTPLIRMTNINLAYDPGGPTLDELIADTKRGLYMDINKSWSIDDLRLNFSFGCEYAWLIEDGKRTALVKNPVYTALTPKFWGACDAVCNADSWQVWGVPNCGKGQPMQTARVAHGCGAARFRDIQVGRKK